MNLAQSIALEKFKSGTLSAGGPGSGRKPEGGSTKDLARPHAVFRKGGSTGEGQKSAEFYNQKGHLLVSTHDSEHEAKDKAERMNKLRSPGDKSYYGIKYYVGRSSSVKTD